MGGKQTLSIRIVDQRNFGLRTNCIANRRLTANWGTNCELRTNRGEPGTNFVMTGLPFCRADQAAAFAWDYCQKQPRNLLQLIESSANDVRAENWLRCPVPNHAFTGGSEGVFENPGAIASGTVCVALAQVCSDRPNRGI